MQLHWLEAKQLDRVTNFSTEIEILKRGKERKIITRYYCTFRKEKKKFEVDSVRYLGFFKNRYLKAVEFQLRVVLKCAQLVLTKNDCVIMVNQDLIKHALFAYWINKLLRRKNKFILDIRTTPTIPESFDRDMEIFHNKFKHAVKHFHGLGFITPFMEKYTMERYDKKLPVVHWSSGVDQELFDYKQYPKKEGGAFSIFYHGGISESRGNLTLIKACEEVRRKGHLIELVQVGICVDKSILAYIQDNNLESWCKLLPPVSLKDIPPFIADSDLPVLPFPNFDAWRVSSPIKLMEYLSMGKKVLAPNMEAFTDVFDGNEHLIHYFDTHAKNQVEAMANKIIAILQEESTKNNQAEELFDFVTPYSWTNQADKLLNFCNEL